MERLDEVPSVAALLEERNKLQAKVAALSAAMMHPWPKSPDEMHDWLEIRRAAINGVDIAVAQYETRITDQVKYEIQLKLTRLANHIYNTQEKDYPSNALDRMAMWVSGPLYGLGTSDRDKWWQKVTTEVEEKIQKEKK